MRRCVQTFDRYCISWLKYKNNTRCSHIVLFVLPRLLKRTSQTLFTLNFINKSICFPFQAITSHKSAGALLFGAAGMNERGADCCGTLYGGVWDDVWTCRCKRDRNCVNTTGFSPALYFGYLTANTATGYLLKSQLPHQHEYGATLENTPIHSGEQMEHQAVNDGSWSIPPPYSISMSSLLPPPPLLCQFIKALH